MSRAPEQQRGALSRVYFTWIWGRIWGKVLRGPTGIHFGSRVNHHASPGANRAERWPWLPGLYVLLKPVSSGDSYTRSASWCKIIPPSTSTAIGLFSCLGLVTSEWPLTLTCLFCLSRTQSRSSTLSFVLHISHPLTQLSFTPVEIWRAQTDELCSLFLFLSSSLLKFFKTMNAVWKFDLLFFMCVIVRILAFSHFHWVNSDNNWNSWNSCYHLK